MHIKQVRYILIITALFVSNCSGSTDYYDWAETELKQGPAIDSLFLGYYFGMHQDDFFMHSWELNKKKLVRHGSGNNSIRYEISELKKPAVMNFYPGFDNGEIHQMRVVYNYNGWAPWNKDLSADSLKVDLINLYEKKLDVKFENIRDPEGKSHTISIEGNREIEITSLGNGAVEVLYRDLRYESNLNRFKDQS